MGALYERVALRPAGPFPHHNPPFVLPGTLLLLVPLGLFSWACLILQKRIIHLQSSGKRDLGAGMGKSVKDLSTQHDSLLSERYHCSELCLISLSLDSLQFSLSREQPFSLLLGVGRHSHLAAWFGGSG